MNFDPVGVGHGVTAVLARHQQDNLFCRGVNVGANPTTDEPTL